jgi:predicted CXXCH cytochrome family protein
VRAVAPDAPELQALGAFADEAIASETKYLLGAGDHRRFLKRSPHYGKLELLSVSLAEIEGRDDEALQGVHWDPDAFGDRCAGCHATAVDAKMRAFSALSLDCFTCHGDVSLEHTKQPSLVLLSAENREPRVVASLCGQCHLRGGASRSSGLPYPNNFVAGDNLFRDFQVDFSDEAIAQLAPLDRHVWLSVRSVVQGGGATTCLDCHDVHAASMDRHAAVARDAMCAVCHKEDSEGGVLNEDYPQAIAAGGHSDVCEY